MTYRFLYEPDYEKLLFAVIVDARASIPEIKNKIGDVIKAYVDSKVALITGETIVYKIEETVNCVLCGFFVVSVNATNKTGVLSMKQLRPAFMQYNGEITTEISNFIQDKLWLPDILI